MRRCIQLASNGWLEARPNPMVGAVIVCPSSSGDGERIIGEGYHVRCGEGHAEVNAFASVSPEDEPLLKESTIYVSLEPCAHYGRTPPCCDLIISKGIRRVVVGCVDPFAKVQGRGIQRIREDYVKARRAWIAEIRKDAEKEFAMGDVEQEVFDDFISKLDHEIDYED